MDKLIQISLVILIFFSLVSCSKEVANGNSKIEKVKLPINLSKKAWFLVSTILEKQSCISEYGFQREARDYGNEWLLIVKDKNPNIKTSCNQTQFIVNKNSGIISFKN